MQVASPPLSVLVSGSNGMIGGALSERLEREGRSVTRLTRDGAPGPGRATWDPSASLLEAAPLEGLDGVVHLAGESIAEGRWTAEKKRRIEESRTAGTRLLCETLAGLERPPRVLVCASAIGYYGHRGDLELDEHAGAGEGFLARVCQRWEEACEPARQAGIRVVNLRIGVVLGRRGGALAKMLTPFRLGLGGRLGSGRQWMSWITLDDVVGALSHALADDELAGPVNAVAPAPVTNAEFTRTLGRVLGRPTLFPVPAVGARLAFGQLADELLLSSIRVRPGALDASGFTFRHPELEGALRHVLGA